MDPILANNYELYKRLMVDFELRKHEQWVEFPTNMQMSKYKYSTFGKVWSKYSNRPLSLQEDLGGYTMVTIYFDNGKKITQKVHTLGASAFIPNLENKPTVNHINSNRHDNCIWNLEWATKLEQAQNPITKIKKSSKRMQASVLQLDLNNNIIKCWPSVKEAAISVGISSSNIVNVCKGKYGCKTSGGFKWKYDNDDLPNEEWREITYRDEKFIVSSCGRLKRDNGPIITGHIEAGYRKTETSNGNSIKFSKIVCLAFHGPPSQPNMIVNHKDGNKLNDRADNLEWLTQKDNIQHAFDNGLVDTKNIRILNSKPVYQLDLNGNLIAEFSSAEEASMNTGFSKGVIRCSCNRGRGTSISNGYIWKYKINT